MRIKSNIELLRVVLFLMVVSIHVTTVGLVIDNGGMQYGSFPYYYASMMRLFVNPAVIGFVLISGFLMVNKDVDVKKYLKKIGAPFLVYFPILLLFDYTMVQGNVLNKISTVYADLVSVVGVFYHLWFIVVLAALGLLIPYINKLLSYCSKKQHLLLLFLLTFISTVNITSSLFLKKQLLGGFLGSDSRLFLFITIYIIGAYFGRYGMNIKKQIALLIYITIPISIFMYCAFNSYASVLKYVELAYPFVILQGVCLFLFFVQLEFNSKIINYFGSLVYGSYIIHVFYIAFLQKFLPFTTFFASKYYFLIDLSFILIVVVASFITEIVRINLYKILMPVISSVVSMIRFKFNKIVMIGESVN